MLPDHREPLDPDGPPVGRCAACGAALPATARFCASCGRSVEVPSSDERRPVTILFADIVGSTSLAERLDAEDWKAVVDPALARFTAVVERHGGRVAQLLGDGLLAFFGAPVAHEDDAIRAVQAGLGLVEAARRLGSRTVGSPDAHLEIRVGISSGEVVVGAVGGEGRREYLAVGDAVNVAARLQAAAPPMGVLVSDETFRLVADAVEGRGAGPLSLKGKANPVVAHEIVALRTVVGHGRRVRDGGPLVGREEELGRLAPLRERLEAGAGAVVSVVGEPGLGKTRLVREWHRSLEDPGPRPHPVRWVDAGCLTTGRDLPYHLARECLRGLLEVADERDPAAVRRAAETAAARLTGLDDAAPLLARLLDLPPTPEDEAALAGLDGRAIQRRLARALRALIESIASGTSLVLVAEDVHWIDPSSAELLARRRSWSGATCPGMPDDALREGIRRRPARARDRRSPCRSATPAPAQAPGCAGAAVRPRISWGPTTCPRPCVRWCSSAATATRYSSSSSSRPSSIGAAPAPYGRRLVDRPARRGYRPPEPPGPPPRAP